MSVLVFWKPLNNFACNGDATVDIVDVDVDVTDDIVATLMMRLMLIVDVVDVNADVDVVDVDVDHLCEDPVEPLQGPVQVKLW